ncbi:MAG: hypothetical protein AAF982_09135 [Pseudomonadota bacterium]
MLRLVSLAAFGLVAACDLPAPAAVPRGVALTDRYLDVFFSQGAVCRTRVDLSSGVARGRMEGCPTEIAYVVTVNAATNPVRFIFRELGAAVSAAGVFRPNATITLTRTTGQVFKFASLGHRRNDAEDL